MEGSKHIVEVRLQSRSKSLSRIAANMPSKNRASRSNVRHCVPLFLNTRLFSSNFRRGVVRTDKTYVDLEDLLCIMFAPEQAKRLLTLWKNKCSAGDLKRLIHSKVPVFADRVRPTDISLVKWIRCDDETSRPGRSRIACSSIGMCTILSLIKNSRQNHELESAIHYFHSISLSGCSLDVMFNDNSAVETQNLPETLLKLTRLPYKPLVNWELCSESLNSCQLTECTRTTDAMHGVDDAQSALSINSTQIAFFIE